MQFLQNSSEHLQQLNCYLFLFQMNNSIIVSNLALNAAYQHFQTGKIESAILEYQKALRGTYPEDLKVNIKCTIAVLEQSLGKYDQSLDLLSSVSTLSKHNNNSIVLLRAFSNLTLMEILEGRYTNALQYFQQIMEVIEKEKSNEYKHQLLQFTTFLFFRVTNLEEIGESIQSMDFDGMRLEEVYAMSLMAFSSECCRLESQQKIQKKCYDQFLKNHRYDLAVLSLRSLIFFSKTKNLVNRDHYEKELAKLVMMGYFSQEIDFNNYEPFEIIQAIMEQFIIFKNKVVQKTEKEEMKHSQIVFAKKKESNDAQIIVEWIFSLSIIRKELARTRQMDNQSKKHVCEMLEGMKEERNPLIIRSMVKNSYFSKYYLRTQKALKTIPQLLFNKSKKVLTIGFQNLKRHLNILESINTNEKSIIFMEEKSKSSIKQDRSKSFTRSREEKQNCIPLGISIVSIASSKISKESTRKKIFGEDSLQMAHKKMLKMVRLCQHGSFLNKRNFNSEGGEFKFVKINHNFIKWGKDPEKIQTNCQIYPLKDIRSIVYGRVSPNLNESCNKMLNYSHCFSLLLQKRTLDFYCKNYEQLEAWTCGLTHVLKKDGNKVVGYSPGKLRWKKMFAILRQNFTEPLKVGERHKFYFENAYALKLFAKNGYKLPARLGERK